MIQKTIVPWRRKHAEKMANFAETEIQTQIELKKAEVLETRSVAIKNRAEAEKLKADCAIQIENAERMRLENEKLRVEIQKEKINLALQIINGMNNYLSEVDKISYMIRLLPLLDTIILSDVDIKMIGRAGDQPGG
ncbi:MAG: hypothetical protein ACXW4Q_15070 [Anaerolineales bacterium]